MAKRLVYELNTSYEAVDKVKSEFIGVPVTVCFKKGELVIGESYYKDFILVEKKYIIPKGYVTKTDKFPFLKKESHFDQTIEKIKEKAKTEKEREKMSNASNDIKNVVEGKKSDIHKKESKYYKNGALIGIGGGMLLSFYLKKNIWFMSLIGLAVGGYVASEMLKTKKIQKIKSHE